MHVIRVELENIKAYGSAEFNFERGTTAIVGRNGAGKTTILEAIAWVLFDTLEYSKDDFLRRGAKKGSVRVTFESNYDGRQYVVYRDTGTNYYVFDPVLNARIAEKKTDTAAFLRAHLGIEPGTDLKSLFRSAIGVPQGSFTSEFLLAPNARKAAFDRLLKVEEYREGAERLRETNNLIRERIAEIRERIAGAEGQLARYDELVAELKATRERERELEETLGALQAEAREREAAVVMLDEAERRVGETRSVMDRLAALREAAEQHLRGAERELAAAERARERQQATADEYAEHRAALEALRELETERAERDPLRSEEQRVAALLGAAQHDTRRLSDALAKSEEAGRAAADLGPRIEEQGALERERERLRDLRAQAEAAHRASARLDKDLELLRAQHAQTKERVRAAEAAGGAQKLVEQLESDRLDIENQLARARDLATERKHLSGQRRELEQEIGRLRGVIDSLAHEAEGYNVQAARAPQVNGLETREQALAEQAARLRAEIARDEKMRLEVRGGLCPILSQKCLNVGEGQTLEGYFTDHLAANQETLLLVEAERREISGAVRAAREAILAATRLESAQARLAHERELLGAREESLAALNRKLQIIGTNGDNQL
ncbi:MAG TPA: SMC family ATPase, partial [Pyrinomonadaceae bacterium]|nr:SMC family ATPase [Pyrinomonadaceae bacterium]